MEHIHTVLPLVKALKTDESGYGNTGSVGAGEEIEIMPPYITVNAWQRVS